MLILKKKIFKGKLRKIITFNNQNIKEFNIMNHNFNDFNSESLVVIDDNLQFFLINSNLDDNFIKIIKFIENNLIYYLDTEKEKLTNILLECIYKNDKNKTMYFLNWFSSLIACYQINNYSLKVLLNYIDNFMRNNEYLGINLWIFCRLLQYYNLDFYKEIRFFIENYSIQYLWSNYNHFDSIYNSLIILFYHISIKNEKKLDFIIYFLRDNLYFLYNQYKNEILKIILNFEKHYLQIIVKDNDENVSNFWNKLIDDNENKLVKLFNYLHINYILEPYLKIVFDFIKKKLTNYNLNDKDINKILNLIFDIINYDLTEYFIEIKYIKKLINDDRFYLSTSNLIILDNINQCLKCYN